VCGDPVMTRSPNRLFIPLGNGEEQIIQPFCGSVPSFLFGGRRGAVKTQIVDLVVKSYSQQIIIID